MCTSNELFSKWKLFVRAPMALRNVSEPLPLHLKNVTASKGSPEKGSLHSRGLAHKPPELLKIDKFIPSPEMAIDVSQSSESNEKPVFNRDHHYVRRRRQLCTISPLAD